MSASTASELFDSWGPNVMTPYRVAVRDTPERFVELSEGTGMEGRPIWGVTAVLRDSLVVDQEWSGLFHSRGDAEEAFLSVP